MNGQSVSDQITHEQAVRILKSAPEVSKLKVVFSSVVCDLLSSKTAKQLYKIPLLHCELSQFNPNLSEGAEFSDFTMMSADRSSSVCLQVDNSCLITEWFNALYRNKRIIEGNYAAMVTLRRVVPAPYHGQVVKCGWLSDRLNATELRKVYVCLTDYDLSIYSSPPTSSQECATKAVKAYPLTDIKCRIIRNEAWEDKRRFIHILCVDGGMHFMTAENAAETSSWLHNIAVLTFSCRTREEPRIFECSYKETPNAKVTLKWGDAIDVESGDAGEEEEEEEHQLVQSIPLLDVMSTVMVDENMAVEVQIGSGPLQNAQKQPPKAVHKFVFENSEMAKAFRFHFDGFMMARQSDKGDDIIAHFCGYQFEILHRLGEIEKLSDYYKRNIAFARTPSNQNKNRYHNVLPYEDTRVVLKSPAGVQVNSSDATNNSIALINSGNNGTNNNNPYLADYINASFIDGRLCGGKSTYIATQGPMRETIGDFWRMVWEHNVNLVVMLTRLEEGGGEKCVQYWPDEGELLSFRSAGPSGCDSKMTVRQVKVRKTTHAYTIREFEVSRVIKGDDEFVADDYGYAEVGGELNATFTTSAKKASESDENPYVEICGDSTASNNNNNSNNNNKAAEEGAVVLTRRVVHYQYLDWPDFGVPADTRSMEEFLEIMRLDASTVTEEEKRRREHENKKGSADNNDEEEVVEEMPSSVNPIIVHCSAGIGRSGTYIAVDVNYDRVEAKKTVDLRYTVSTLREQRYGMVQTADQYTFSNTLLTRAPTVCKNGEWLSEKAPWLVSVFPIVNFEN
eukprot:Nk52_evm77s151 gene=Nk52_evmTU77s151